jgi:hypothetical protein
MLRRLTRKLTWKVIDTLNWLACRSFNRAEYRMLLDDDSTRFYPIISKKEQLEVNQITVKQDGESTDTAQSAFIEPFADKPRWIPPGHKTLRPLLYQKLPLLAAPALQHPNRGPPKTSS